MCVWRDGGTPSSHVYEVSSEFASMAFTCACAGLCLSTTACRLILGKLAVEAMMQLSPPHTITRILSIATSYSALYYSCVLFLP
jgi:hypothetical protein